MNNPEKKEDTHYVASIKIEKVVKRVVSNERGAEPKRVVDEVTHMTIKAQDLNDLKSRITAHVDLVEDD